MRKFYSLANVMVVFACLPLFLFGQVFTNRGTDFWVGFQASQSTGTSMKVYMGALDHGDSVRVAIGEGTANQWIRTYWVPAHATIASEEIPKTGINGAYLATEGKHANKGIHITSKSHPIVAYAHLFDVTNSGATLLLPVNLYASENYVFTTTQNYSNNSYSAFQIIAAHDSTWVEINPAKPTLGGWQPNGGAQPNGSYLVKLNKGDVYQVLGAIITGTQGHDLTGSIVRAVPNGQGEDHPIAVFCGSSRTAIDCSTGATGTGDLIIQQVFPYQLWGTRYATSPFVIEVSTNPFTSLFGIIRILVRDITTVVKRNGVPLLPSTLKNGNYYEFISNQPEYITSDKPVLVAQYMTSAGKCGNPSNTGDPEMIYLTPVSNAIPQTSFYRNTDEDIKQNFLSLVIPSAGLASLKIDGLALSGIPAANQRMYGHPTLPGYSVVVRKWPAAKAQVYVESNYAFTGITYGVGPVESYGYNIGSQFDSAGLESIKFNTIHAFFFLDKNNDGIRDTTEPLYPHGRLQIIKGVDTLSSISGTGSIIMYTDTGTYVSNGLAHASTYRVVPATHTSFFNSYNNIDTVFFSVQTIPGVRDISVKMIGLGAVRPGFRTTYKIVYKNLGTDTADVHINLLKDNRLQFDSASLQPTIAAIDTIKWLIPALKPAETGEIKVYFKVISPPTVNLGDTLYSMVNVSTNKPDVDSTNDTAYLSQRVTNAYDPNNKTEAHNGQLLARKVAQDELLQYTIRFQNTGNDTAFTVVVRDTLDAKLDWNSLSMISASHNYQLNMDDGKLVWVFDNIMLVDSNRNEPLSHGYISFNIKSKSTVVAGDVISNRASIYFDHNLPIVTNTEHTTIIGEPLPVKLVSFVATRGNRENILEWRTVQEASFSHFELQRSINGRDFIEIARVIGGSSTYRYDDNSFEKAVNYYRLKMIDRDGAFSYSEIRKINNSGEMEFAIYPNPAKELLNVKIESLHQSAVRLQVISVDGRTVIHQIAKVSAGTTIIAVNTGTLASGNYFIRLSIEGKEVRVMKFEKR